MSTSSFTLKFEAEFPLQSNGIFQISVKTIPKFIYN